MCLQAHFFCAKQFIIYRLNKLINMKHIKLFEQFISERGGETGLYAYPTTAADFKKLEKWLEDSDYYAEVDSNRGYVFFPEEKRKYDALEAELDDEFNKARISARFEAA